MRNLKLTNITTHGDWSDQRRSLTSAFCLSSRASGTSSSFLWVELLGNFQIGQLFPAKYFLVIGQWRRCRIKVKFCQPVVDSCGHQEDGDRYEATEADVSHCEVVIVSLRKKTFLVCRGVNQCSWFLLLIIFLHNKSRLVCSKDVSTPESKHGWGGGS